MSLENSLDRGGWLLLLLARRMRESGWVNVVENGVERAINDVVYCNSSVVINR